MPWVVGVPPSSTCQFQLDEDKGSRRDFSSLACLVALAAASMHVMCHLIAGSFLTFLSRAEFSLSAWDATVDRARTLSPLMACLLASVS